MSALVCRTCGEDYPEFGDGWEGECPDCADRTYAAESRPTPLPKDTPWGQIDLRTHSLTGWPKGGECPHCAGELCLLVATHAHASYECRGSLPHPPGSAYTDDRCRGQWSVQRFDRAK